MIDFIDLFSGIGGFRLGLERANYSTYEQIENGNASSRGTSFEEKRKSQLSARNSEVGLEKANCGFQGNKKHDKGSKGRWERSSGTLYQQTRGNSLDDRNGSHTDDISSKQLPTQSRGWNENEEEIPNRHSSSTSGEGRAYSAELRYRCVWSCDWNKYANQVYTKQFGEANHHSGDIRGVDPGEIPDFDLLCAGFPCQSFSVAGKRQGFQDTRGTVFFEISRIAEAKRPQMLLLENVRGLLSSDRGQTFQTILQELGRIGYWTEWQILNSKHHGVPQNRERVFIIGHLRNGCSRSIFPIGRSNERTNKTHRKKPAISSTLKARYGHKGFDDTYIVDSFNRSIKKGAAYSLKTNPSSTSSDVIALGSSKPTVRSGGRGSLDRHAWDTIAVLTPDRAEKRQHGRRFKEPGEPAFTLTGQDIHGVAISFTNPHDSEEERKINLNEESRTVKPPYGNQQPLILHNIYGGFKEDIRTFEENSPTIRTAKGGGHLPSVLQDYRIRRLTPIECERLQGFPDGWTEYGYVKDAVLDYEPVYGWAEKYDEETDEWEEIWEVIGKNPIDPIDKIVRISDTQRYKCLGNAVTVNVIEFLGELIKSQFKKNAHSEDRVDG